MVRLPSDVTLLFIVQVYQLYSINNNKIWDFISKSDEERLTGRASLQTKKIDPYFLGSLIVFILTSNSDYKHIYLQFFLLAKLFQKI